MSSKGKKDEDEDAFVSDEDSAAFDEKTDEDKDGSASDEKDEDSSDDLDSAVDDH